MGIKAKGGRPKKVKRGPKPKIVAEEEEEEEEIDEEEEEEAPLPQVILQMMLQSSLRDSYRPCLSPHPNDIFHISVFNAPGKSF